jgi:hypothetical protein
MMRLFDAVFDTGTDVSAGLAVFGDRGSLAGQHYEHAPTGPLV